MAVQSVATRATTTPANSESSGHRWSETDVYERIADRLNGIQAVTTLAAMAIENNSNPTQGVLLDLFGFIELVADDIHHDAYRLRSEARRMKEA